MYVWEECECKQKITRHVPPDENDLDFRRSVIDDGGGILVTPAIQDLTIDLEEKSGHESPHNISLCPSISTLICHLLSTLSVSHPPPRRSSAPIFLIATVTQEQESRSAPSLKW